MSAERRAARRPPCSRSLLMAMTYLMRTPIGLSAATRASASSTASASATAARYFAHSPSRRLSSSVSPVPGLRRLVRQGGEDGVGGQICDRRVHRLDSNRQRRRRRSQSSSFAKNAAFRAPLAPMTDFRSPLYRLRARTRSPRVAISDPTKTVSDKPRRISPAANRGVGNKATIGVLRVESRTLGAEGCSTAVRRADARSSRAASRVAAIRASLRASGRLTPGLKREQNQ
jgi:hypothetical protein